MTRFPLLPLALILFACSPAVSQATEKVIYSFSTQTGDGELPNGGLIFDKAGNLYGTTSGTSSSDCGLCGIAFELTPSPDGSWAETVLYHFCSQPNCSDGESPGAGMVFDSAGNLYGTTTRGGQYYGTVFELSPPSAPGDSWTETTLWSFDGTDGDYPVSNLIIDASGDLYGTASEGGAYGRGTVFELSPGPSGWTHNVLYNFCSSPPVCSDGARPITGLTLDKSGNLYGTTYQGGQFGEGKWGVAYELSPLGGGNWIEKVLYAFSAKAGNPATGLSFDTEGNLYGALYDGAENSPATCGGVFRLAPNAGNWKESFLPLDIGCNPSAGGLVDNKTKAFVGITPQNPVNDAGSVFEVNGGGQTILYNFCQLKNCADGLEPGGILPVHNGKLYGTTLYGGTGIACGPNQNGCGTVFEITP
jgi:uncharacterized repeat protein (TIGR03803 family)